MNIIPITSTSELPQTSFYMLNKTELAQYHTMPDEIVYELTQHSRGGEYKTYYVPVKP